MLDKFIAHADLHAATNRLQWKWRGDEPTPELHLIRRRRAYPTQIDDGLEIVNLVDIFDLADSTHAYMQRYLCLAHNMQPDSGLFLADLKLFASLDSIQNESNDESPIRITAKLLQLSYYDVPTKTIKNIYKENVICKIKRFYNHANELLRETITLFKETDPQNSIGSIEFLLEGDDVSVTSLIWTMEGSPSITINFEERKVFSTTALVDKYEDADQNEFVHSYTIFDKGLESGINYYYSIYKTEKLDEVQVTQYTDLAWRAHTMATGNKGMADLLYRSLPSMHQYYDETESPKNNDGTLQRYLSINGAMLDQTRSTAEGLRDLNDVHNVDINRLPGLARQLGWEPDLTLDALKLRSDIHTAPEVYRTVGTVPNIRSLVNRITGWDSNVKEFVHNVFRSNAPETIRLWEIYERRLDATNINSVQLAVPNRIARADGLDGHPCAVVDSDDETWITWHSNRSGGRDIWIKKADKEGSYAVKTQLNNPLVNTAEIVINEYPATLSTNDRLWLFWNDIRVKDQTSQSDVWVTYQDRTTPEEKQVVPFTTYLPDQKLNLSQHPTADDRWPTAVMDSNSSLQVLWQSNRRGPTDIWMKLCLDPVNAPLNWGLPTRVTTAQHHHTQPNVVSDGIRLWLFFTNELGDRSNIYCKVITDDMTVEEIVDAEVVPITQGKQLDGAPSTVFMDGKIWVFWQTRYENVVEKQNVHQSRRRIQWKILGQAWEWDEVAQKPNALNDAFIVSNDVSGDKEPSVIIDNSNDKTLRVLWRSQRRGRDYQSRSFNINDPEMLVNKGTFNDRLHYTYDTRKKNENRYARDTVGVFLTPNNEQPDLIDRSYRLMNGPLRNFMPVNVRPILAINDTVYEEYFSVDEDFIGDTRAFVDTYSGATDSYADVVPQWMRMRSVKIVKDGDVIIDRLYLDHVTGDKTYRSWHTGLQA